MGFLRTNGVGGKLAGSVSWGLPSVSICLQRENLFQALHRGPCVNPVIGVSKLYRCRNQRNGNDGLEKPLGVEHLGTSIRVLSQVSEPSQTFQRSNGAMV